MSASAQPERLNQEGFAAFADRAGEGSWDSVVLVEYPTRGAFLDMIGSAEYQQIAHLRTEALVKGELHPMAQNDELT